MTEHELTAALDALVDRCDDERGDWQAVLGRAGVESRRPRRRARRIGIIAFATLALVGVAVVSTGFGRDALSSLLGRIHVDFWSSDPAPQPVRWQFEDLGIGAPPRFAPQAIVSQARTVGTLDVHGKERTLSVVPTRRGGFCYMLERGGGGCRPGPSPEGPRLAASQYGGFTRGESEERILGVSGLLFGDEIERVSVEFANGDSEDLDFVYVSEPIDAGFFYYTAPEERQLGAARLSAVVARDGSDEVVARQDMLRPRLPGVMPNPLPRSAPSQGRPLPTRPTPAPTAPAQRGTANGVSFTVGRNGAVLVDLDGIEADRRALLDRFNMGYSCFELVKRGGVTHDRGVGASGRFQESVGFQLHGLPTPVDGCTLTGIYGRRWPGKLGFHDVVEVPFTEAGRRFFEDRAAARDVSFFLRQTEMRELRRTSSPLSAEEMRDAFGPKIAALPSRAASPPEGTIGYWADGSGLLLRRVSSTGRRFEVVVGPKGGVIQENLEPYAMVF